jgi:hypothetical protein
MAIREATTSATEPAAGPRPDRRRRRRDLRAGPFPTAAMEQWQDTEAALTQLYRYAEGRAIDAVDWYLQDKRGKRVWSRGLRLLAIAPVTAGALQPLLDAARASRTAWGYVLLAMGAACVGFDRFFGVSSGWMRSMTCAQALERRLEQLEYDWAPECARSAARTVDPKQVQNRLALLRRRRRPPAAGDGLLGAGVPEQPAAPGALERRLFRVGTIARHRRALRRPEPHAHRSRTGAGGAAQAADRRQGVPLTWRARSGSWPPCASRRPRPTCGTTRSGPARS